MNLQETSSDKLINYWLVVTSPGNFTQDREVLNFAMQGLPIRNRSSLQRMQIGDRIVYYIMNLYRFGATATITGEYLEEQTKLWTDDDEMWPARRPSRPDIVLQDDELVDAKKLVPNLTFIERKEIWGVYLQGSVRQIPEEDFRLIESEMKKAIAGRVQRDESKPDDPLRSKESEDDIESAILALPLETKTLHDRLGEMLEERLVDGIQHADSPQNHA